MPYVELRKQDRDKIAALLSIIPGVGHLYKHHYISGLCILIGGNLIMLLVTGLLTPATFFIAPLIVPPAYILAVAAGAYYLEDWHGKHHYLHPWRKDE